MSKLADLLAVARSQIGTAESPSGSNNQKYGAWYPMNGVAWCGIFVSWCVAQVGLQSVIPKYAYTPTGAQWFKDRGQWGTTPKAGAIAFYNIGGLGRISHTGIVESVLSDGSFYAIEGNTSGSGGRTGGEVWRQHRSNMGSGGGFGYPKYPTEVATIAAVQQPAATTAAAAAPTIGPAASTAPGYPGLLQRGSKGSGVTTLQNRLNEHLSGSGLAKIGVDGDFGPGTDKAVRWYQECRHGAPFNLDIDGQVGPATWKSLWQ